MLLYFINREEQTSVFVLPMTIYADNLFSKALRMPKTGMSRLEYVPLSLCLRTLVTTVFVINGRQVTKRLTSAFLTIKISRHHLG